MIVLAIMVMIAACAGLILRKNSVIWVDTILKYITYAQFLKLVKNMKYTRLETFALYVRIVMQCFIGKIQFCQ